MMFLTLDGREPENLAAHPTGFARDEKDEVEPDTRHGRDQLGSMSSNSAGSSRQASRSTP